MKSIAGTAKKAVSLAIITTTVLLSSGCVSFTYQHDAIEEYLLLQQPEEALAALESRKLAKRDKIIYYLDKSILLRMQGDFTGSNAALEATKKMVQKLQAISLREQAGAISINDAMRSYLPPFFEQIMLHCIMALNYLELNEANSARVEALQLNELIKQNDDKEVMPFAHTLIGLVFEANQELDEALIAYRKSYEAYQKQEQHIPVLLQNDLLRLTQHLGLDEEQEKYQNEFQIETWPTQAELKQRGQVVTVIFNGLIPRKHSTEINAQSFKDGQLHRISVPFYETRTTEIDSATLSIKDKKSETELIAKLDLQAQKNLDDEMPGIIARTIARVSVKNRLVDNTREQSPLVSAALNITTFVTEHADTRAWNTLPQQIMITRLAVDPGIHDLDARLDNTSSNKSWHDVPIDGNTIHFFSWHWPNSHVTFRSPRK